MSSFSHSQNFYTGLDISGMKEIDADPAYKPHNLRYSYNLSLRPAILLDSLFDIEAILGYSKSEFKFDALLTNGYSKGFETGIGINYFPVKFKANVLPRCGLNALYREQNDFFKDNYPVTAFYKGFIVQLNLGLALKVTNRFFLIPTFTISHLKPTHFTYPRLGEPKTNYNLKLNLSYFFK